MRYALFGIVTALAAALLALPSAHADSCRSVIVPTRTVHHGKPVATVFVAEPVAVPPLFPYPVLFQWIAQPTTPPPVAIAGSLLPAPATQVQAPSEVEQRLARIEAALLKLSGAGPQALAAPVAYAEGEQPPTRNDGAVKAPQAAKGPAQAPASAYVPQVAALLQQKCAQCHSEPGRGNVHLFDLAGTFNPNVSAEDIWQSVARDRMPKTPGNKLIPEEKALVRAWMEAENRRGK